MIRWSWRFGMCIMKGPDSRGCGHALACIVLEKFFLLHFLDKGTLVSFSLYDANYKEKVSMSVPYLPPADCIW
jgi:hypothetical protein